MSAAAACVELLQLRNLRAGAADLLIQGPSLRVGDAAGGVVGLHLIVNEGVKQVLLTQVLEEVLLAPALEHAVGDFYVAQIPPAGDDRGLVAVVAQTGHLSQPQGAFEKAHRLVMQTVLDFAPFDASGAEDEPMCSDAASLALAVGQDVEGELQELLEELRAPAASVEDNGQAAVAGELAHLG